MKRLLFVYVPFLLIILTLSSISKPVPNEQDGIKWMNFKELQEAEKKQPRKVIIDVYTQWCGWCKRMDATTYTNPDIIKYISDNFYAVKFDAEDREVINFKDRDYKYVSQGRQGYNELAAYILNGQMSYPTVVYFDENLDGIFPVPGFQDSKGMEALLNFVASNSYKTVRWEDYQKDFKGKIQ